MSNDTTIVSNSGNIYVESNTIWYYNIPGGDTVANLRSNLIVNNEGASFKIVSVDTSITNASEFNSAVEKLPNDALGSSNVKVVVKAEDGTLKSYNVYWD